jgi:hypothetical protein
MLNRWLCLGYFGSNQAMGCNMYSIAVTTVPPYLNRKALETPLSDLCSRLENASHGESMRFA